VNQLIIQNKIHQNIIIKNDNIECINILFNIMCFSKIIHIIIEKRATEVQSLKRLSPSNIKVSLFGAHILLNKATIATGSVAEIIAQNKRVINMLILYQNNHKIYHNIIHIKIVEIITQKKAKLDIVIQFFDKFFMLILYADSNNNIGKKPKNTNSGVSLKSSIKLKYHILDNGNNNSHIVTNKTVYGRFILLLIR